MNETNENITIGVIATIVLLTMAVFALFAWPPVSYYLSKWGDYWTEHYPVGAEFSIDQDQIRASQDCFNRAKEKYGFSDGLASDASSTSGHYKTYDCYALPWVKI